MLTAALAGQAPAQTTPATKPDRAALLARLDAPSWADRAAAHRELLADASLTVADVEQLLASESLSPEARQRLMRVGASLFMRAPRAAMGVTFDATQRAGDGGAGAEWGVAVGGTQRGFDSERVLRQGDIVRAIAGEPVREILDARAAIVSFDPGTEVQLDIERDGEAMTVSLRLGDYRSLPRMPSLDEGFLRVAWDVRVRRALREARLASSPPLDAGLTARDVRSALEREIATDALARQRAGEPDEPAQTIDPATGQLQGPSQRDRDDARRTLTVVGGGRQRSVGVDVITDFRLAPLPLDNEEARYIRGVQASIDADAADIRRLRSVLRNGDVPRAERQRIEGNIALLERNIAQVRGDLVTLQRQRDTGMLR